MDLLNYPSKLLEEAVSSFSSLPGIGRKTALRLVLHLLKQDKDSVLHFSSSLTKLKNEVKFCKICHNISDNDICGICSSSNRNKELICVVETLREVMVIEQTGQYNGLYHVLGGIISPMEGIGPNELNINSLISRIETDKPTEIIFALSTTVEGDTTSFYIYKKIAKYGTKVSTIARGVAVGDELQYADEITLGKSIINRLDFMVLSN